MEIINTQLSSEGRIQRRLEKTGQGRGAFGGESAGSLQVGGKLRASSIVIGRFLAVTYMQACLCSAQRKLWTLVAHTSDFCSCEQNGEKYLGRHKSVKIFRTAIAVIIMVLCLSGTAWGQTLTVHDGTATNGYVPLYGFYADAFLKCEFVYPAAELADMVGATISEMTFYASQTDVSWGAANFQVFLTTSANTSISAFSGPGTVVYEGSLSISSGEMTVSFSTPYTYTGGNLLVGIYNTVEGDYVTSSWYGENVNGASVQGYSYSSLGEISPTQRNFLPKTTFTYTPLPTPTITQTLNPLPGCGMDNATLTASLGGASMPTGYAYYWYSDAACTSEITSGVSGTNNNTLSYPASNGTQVWCRLEKRTVTITSTPSSTFDYNGGIQQYTVPPNTISLTLETWGAQGGSYNNTYVGGSGGYAKGTLNSPAIGSTLYVVVGGQPDRVTSTTGGTSVPGGYNGGGNAVVHSWSSGYSVPQGGGGATHIATVSGLLSSLSAQQDNVLVVAGGGSGSVFYHKDSDDTDGGGTGYAGGGGTSSGYTGGSYTYTANQTTAGNGGSFGQGASYTDRDNYKYGPAGGGGGWYGGGNRQYADDTYSAELVLGHGGGSGHVNSSLAGATMTTGGRTGHGMAKITASIGTTTVESVGDAGEISIQCAEVQCEGFESGTLNGWTSESSAGSYTWSAATSYHNGNIEPNTGSYIANLSANTYNNNVTYLISPAMDFGSASSVTLSFWYINQAWGSDIDELTVYYRTSPSNPWVTAPSLFNTTTAHESWTQVQNINLPNISSTYQIAFVMTGNYGYGVGIDDVCFVITPGDCTPPSISFASTSNTGTLGSSYSHPSLTCNSNGTRHWSSSNTNVATVDETSGAVTLKDCGQTTITLSVDANATYCAGTAFYTLNVNGNTPSFTNCPSSNSTNTKSGQTWTPTLNSGMAYSTAHWTSSNSARAVVNTTTGAITNKEPGEVTITATVPASGSYCGGTVSCTYTVECVTNSETFAFSPTTGTVQEGGSTDISGNLTVPSGATVTSYTSDDPSIATVTSSGVVTGVSEGTAHITATIAVWSSDGVTYYCERTTTNSFSITVTYCPQPTGVTVTNITDTSAQVSWTGDADADSYNVRYRKVFLSEDFEDGIPGTWTTIDADGDGYNWNSHINGVDPYLDNAHSGDGIAYSQSYDHDAGVLYPDNWLITPQVNLTGIVSFWHIAQDPLYPENFQVYVSTTGTAVGNFTAISGEITATGTYQQFTADLSSYAGQQGYIAIRHFNVSDQFYLNVDDFGIYADWSTLTTTATSANLTNLDALTTYEVQVQADCGGDGESNWSTEETFETLMPHPIITQTDDPLPECGTEAATLTASLHGGASVPAGYAYYWYSDEECTSEITEGVTGPDNNTLNYDPATDGAHVWCRLEKRVPTTTLNYSTFDYTGGVQTYTVPTGAISLILEVWGAQGGSYSSTYSGGKGGYATGTISSPTSGSQLYVVVGGQGSSVSASETGGTGGYNGGGNGGNGNSSSLGIAGSGGGGATHIATASGQLQTLSSNTSAVLVVAGGGGGASGAATYGGTSSLNESYTAASGGAADVDGNRNTNGTYNGGGGTAGTTASNGVGGAVTTNSRNDRDGAYHTSGGGGGGAGYYGGGGGGGGSTSRANNRGSAGGDGSFGKGGYGGNSAEYKTDPQQYYGGGGGSGAGGASYYSATLTDTDKSAGNSTMPNPAGGTMTGREGNGYARITAALPSGTATESVGSKGTVVILCCGIDAEIQITNP